MEQLARCNAYLAQQFPRGLRIAMEQLPLPQYNFLLWALALVSGLCLFIAAVRYNPKPAQYRATPRTTKTTVLPRAISPVIQTAKSSTKTKAKAKPALEPLPSVSALTATMTAQISQEQPAADWVEVQSRRGKKGTK